MTRSEASFSTVTPPGQQAEPRQASTRPLLIALVLVAAPNMLFLAALLAGPLLSVATLVLAATSLVIVGRDLLRTRAPVDRRLLGGCLAIALVLCLLGGETHVFFANDDWLIRDAVLGDLVKQPWPVGYIYGGDQTILRAPLGLYLVPALVGKALGLHAAHVALLAQDTLLFGAILYTFAADATPRRRAFFIVTVFVVYSGWDVVGQLAIGKSVAFATHLPRWAGGLQFSSTITQIFWAPNHALSGWTFVAAYLVWRRGQLAATSLAVVFGLCVFWSPLSMMGALPFAARAMITDVWWRRIKMRGVAAAALMAVALVPVALYLIADSARVAHGEQALTGDFFVAYAIFLAIEILPYVLIVTLLRPIDGGRGWRTDLAIAIVLLLLAPLFKIGGSDFVMRASIPALTLLALRLAAIAMPGEGRPARLAMPATLVALAVGFVSPLYEIGRALTSPAFAISDCNLMTAARFPPNDGPLFHYVARLDHMGALGGVLARPDAFLKADERRAACWPDDTGFKG